VVADFNMEFESPQFVGILGANGSGKSTLLQLLSGFLTPSAGKLLFMNQETLLSDTDRYTCVSIAAPYVELIEELTLKEFLDYHFTFKKKLVPAMDILENIGLANHANKFIGQCSSGMKQRMKLAQAFFSDTPILLLDEPCSNLDEAGIELYQSLLASYTAQRLVFIASNDPMEYAGCTQFIHMNDLKTSKEHAS
jgi:ABC-type multidrug transport system ATPase subunit